MIDLTLNLKQIQINARLCRERGIVIPTFAQLRDPELVPTNIKESLKKVGMSEGHAHNLYRINWRNEPVAAGGGFGKVNAIELPSALTGVPARIHALSGKWMPTGAHKVGAAYGCLAPSLVTGAFDPRSMKAVWPSTGNYCRGGAYVSSLLGCPSIAILPENMSRERFEWLARVAGEVITTHGCESNVKEIFDKCWELRENRDDVFIFNQFEELGNTLWHHAVTGPAFGSLLEDVVAENERFAGIVLNSGSGGTLAAGAYLKARYPGSRLAVSEALQCPTLINNGFGDHRVEGIGDKHVPWIHDVKSTDMVMALDDEQVVRLFRMFNTVVGHKKLAVEGVPKETIANLALMGLSGIANMLAAIKFAKYYELTERDHVVTVFTDSAELYGSRLEELETERGAYSESLADRDLEVLWGQGLDWMRELSYYDRKRIHNLKYFTWIEQQRKDVRELQAQWRDHDDYWGAVFDSVDEIDALIEDFNRQVARA